jgi:hypothetical protein
MARASWQGPLSFTLRWVTTVASKNRLTGGTVMATATWIL